ncbi:YjcZ family sporulation protein [Priestia endophytica]|nr:YjcZ family sporulation protein [Priestia endophytica]
MVVLFILLIIVGASVFC